ncbi:MAG: 4Fe-4S cluster-binding domain-containing protein [Rickettsiales bacterium]|jgi:MoaA/NifB/PqqE/SkfB family radical SAM enzyme|nr:4Fe-4S cluster-binding domain-containing protein [Rickettsiales bacterium]
MIRNSVFNFGKVRPFCGKYAAKHSDFFNFIEQLRVSLPDDWFFRPLRAEIEITNRCNQKCPSCGMYNLNDLEPISRIEMLKLMNDLKDNRIPSMAITGGEPFIEKETLLELIQLGSKIGVDVSKITTNAFWGHSLKSIKDNLDCLLEAGLLGNRYFVPLIMMSLGEQTVSVGNLSNVIHYVAQNFKETEVHIGVSSLRTNNIHKTDALRDDYFNRYGVDFPENLVHITYSDYVSNDDNNQSENTKKRMRSLEAIENCYMCFDECVGSYVLPTILIKKDGTVYACSCFNVPKKYFTLGNVYREPLRLILERANKNDNIRIIKELGIRGLLAKLPKEEQEKLRDVYVDSYCEVCRILMDRIGELATEPHKNKMSKTIK